MLTLLSVVWIASAAAQPPAPAIPIAITLDLAPLQ
jgi:hypothetical protein